MSKVRLFIITDEGEHSEIPFAPNQLASDEVYLLLDEDGKDIWIYKGANARIRKKFLGARAATELRQDIGFQYKVHSLDEGEDDPDFQTLLGNAEQSTKPMTIKKTEKPPPRTKRKSKTLTKKVKTEDDTSYMQLTDIVPTPTLGTRESSTETKTKTEILPETPLETRVEIASAETKDKKKSPPPTAPSEAPSRLDVATESVMKKLEEIEPLDGYFRELVIIGHDCYAISEKSVKFLGEERVERQLERISTMPEGIFFAEEYTPRIIVEDGKVIAIEFWKASELVSEQLKTQMTRSLDELTSFFKTLEGEQEEI
ncbi:MAG: hypothetical protein ACFFCD_03980 [Promethearchaeota archaeon]